MNAAVCFVLIVIGWSFYRTMRSRILVVCCGVFVGCHYVMLAKASIQLFPHRSHRKEAVSKGAIAVAWGRGLSPARQYGRRKAARYAVLETKHINSGKDDVLKTEF